MAAFVALVLFSQIVVISIIVPGLFHRYVTTEIHRYPETEFPLLYTLGSQVRLSRQRLCERLNVLTAVIALALWVFAVAKQLELTVFSEIQQLCFLIQVMPYLLSAYWEKQVQTLRTKMPNPAVRTATLARRQLRDLVSPIAVFTQAVLLLVVLITTIYFWATNLITPGKAVAVVVANALFSIYVMRKINKNVLNPRNDPYAATKDEFSKAKKESIFLIATCLFLSLSSLFTLAKSAGLMSQENAVIIVPAVVSVIAQAAFLMLAQSKLKKLQTTDYSVFRIEKARA